MLILPLQPLRAEYTSFGLALCTAGLLAALVAWPLLGAPAAGLVAVPALLAGALAALHPQVLARPYHRWNGLAVRYARILRPLLLRVGYHVVVRTAGRAESRMALARLGPHESLWRPREPHDAAAAAAERPAAGWHLRYLRWAVGARQPAALALLPIVLLLRLSAQPAEADDPPDVAENVYTLF